MENLNRSITTKRTRSVIKKTPNKQKSRTRHFTGEFYKTFKEDEVPLHLKLLKKLKRKERFQTHFMRPAFQTHFMRAASP